jgi:2-keto-4-pentenoate hydratase/2-oxohepta-3-ene-1,7-dioic acid hydratase in catechol pathway
MKLTRCRDKTGRIHWVEPVDEDRARPLSTQDPFDRLDAGSEIIDVDTWLAPLQPTSIFGVGLNYRAHAAETGAPLPEHPVLFMKPVSAVIGPGQTIRIPSACEHGPEVDYEAELAVVIGREARNVSVGNALQYVLGYTCANDVSARRWQKHAGGGQWVRGKSFDTFCPLGPVIVTADEIPDPQQLSIRSELNGELMQSSTTADMIFSVAELIAFLSRDTTLLPGTVILTGTPEGVGFARKPPVYLGDGDTIEISVGAIGRLSNPVRTATD